MSMFFVKHLGCW